MASEPALLLAQISRISPEQPLPHKLAVSARQVRCFFACRKSRRAHGARSKNSGLRRNFDENSRQGSLSDQDGLPVNQTFLELSSKPNLLKSAQWGSRRPRALASAGFASKETIESNCSKMAANSQEYVRIKNGGVGEALKTGVLKIKSSVRYPLENSTKSLASVKSATLQLNVI